MQQDLKNKNYIFDMDESHKEDFISGKMREFVNTNGTEISKIDIKHHDISQNLTNMDIFGSPGNEIASNNQFNFEKKKY